MVGEEVHVPRIRSEPCSRACVGNSHKCGEDKMHSISQGRDADRNDDVSESSILDSVSSLDISRDDVVGVVGQKHLWKARKAIAKCESISQPGKGKLPEERDITMRSQIGFSQMSFLCAWCQLSQPIIFCFHQ
ncbi:hypothetical protein MKW92_043172 [Papaver armeniacum]|nr:hypothetical protein MKW92_043172 [Papaver armeniacum]